MLELMPVNEPASVPVTVVTVPATVWVVNTTVAIPFASVVLVGVANDPFGLDFVQVTTLPAVLTALLFVSVSCALIVTSVPAIGL